MNMVEFEIIGILLLAAVVCATHSENFIYRKYKRNTGEAFKVFGTELRYSDNNDDSHEIATITCKMVASQAKLRRTSRKTLPTNFSCDSYKNRPAPQIDD